MKTNIPLRIFAALGAFVAGACSLSRAQFATTTVSTGFDYSSGDYGEATDTEYLVIPLTMRWDGPDWNVKLTVPYVRISGPSSIVPEVGRFSVLRRPSSAAESGLGDIVLGASYGVIVPQDGMGPGVDVTGRVKFGTASRSKGLGTGETDYAGQVDVYQTFGRMTHFGTLGYRVMGDPPGTNLLNHFYGTIGTSYRFSDRTRFGALVDLREKVLRGGDEAVELVAFGERQINDSWRALGYALTGFTDASPNFGLGLSLSYRY